MDFQTTKQNPGRIISHFRLPILIAVIGLLLVVLTASAAVTFQDINPNNSSLDPTDPNGASGGRVNGLASVPGNNQIFYAATEWGGLYETTDGGLTWSRLNGHLPVATWDVEVDASNTSIIYATSFYDGRTNPLSGIQVSYDGGTTWNHPPTAQPNDPASEGTSEDNTPQPNYNCPATRRTEPSAFGIGIRPDAPENVFIGTNCGLAISNDSGATWTFVDPSPANPARDVWDVSVQAGGPTGQGIIDICTGGFIGDRHFRSTDGGNTWVGGSTALPSGRCSIDVSPDESYVLFVYAADNNIYESDNAGTNWTNLGTPDSKRSGRVPFISINQRSDSGSTDRFDLWAGDVRLFRAGCTTPNMPAMGGALRCPMARTGAPASPPPAGWAGPFTKSVGAHDDVGDLVFDTEASNDACPMILSSDGGVFYNTDLGDDCQNPNWEQPNVTPHALWAYGMGGADQPGDTTEDLYFGTQDDGTFAATNAGAASPSFSNIHCCDSFDIVADSNRVIVTTFSPYRLRVCSAGMVGCSTLGAASLPPGCCTQAIQFMFADYLDTFGDKRYVAVTPSGAFITNDITASPVTWTQIGTGFTPAGGFCGVQAAVLGGTPTFYAQTSCIGVFENQGPAQLWKYTGTAPGGNWTRVDNNDGLTGGFGIFAVDPKNPARLYASNLAPAGPQMVFSNNGGQNWNNDSELDNLMNGNGAFNYQTLRGPTSFLGFNGYVQPSLLAYDPEDSNIMVAGGRDTGVFLSTDGGGNWSLLTDPVSSDTSGIPNLPRPWFAYFDHEPADTINLFVGTQGRGVWRFTLRLPTADANGPYVTDEGVDVVLDGTGSSDPDGTALIYEWDLDNDGVFDDATGPNPVFDMVGQDGVFPVALKVTAGGAFDIDETTVTVNNVAPSVDLASNAPVDEGSPVTVSGMVTDPGWLDPLSATIDWGDGSPAENIVGTLENNRPDATFTFSVSHVYGDNGTFNAEVRGFDDDTSTSAKINLTIDNVDPTAVIDLSGTILIGGIPTFLAHAGEPIDFSGRSTDPGSDDLTLRWNWDDGSPIEGTIYLVNPPDPDPFPSPSIQPRDVTDTKSHTFTEACFYEIEFWAEDDDGGLSKVDTAIVIIVGNADKTRTAGYWEHQFRQIGKTDFDEDALKCYLAIAAHMSQVFNEERDASTIEKAQDVLLVDQTSDMKEIFDRQLLAVWLNFANGSIALDEMVDTNGDGTADTLFSDAVSTAEAVRLDPSATRKELEIQKDILERINQSGN